MPTSTHWEVLNSPKITVKTAHSAGRTESSARQKAVCCKSRLFDKLKQPLPGLNGAAVCMLCLFLHGQRLLDLGDDAVGIDAVGVEHQRGLAAAAKLVVDAVADDGHGIIGLNEIIHL